MHKNLSTGYCFVKDILLCNKHLVVIAGIYKLSSLINFMTNVMSQTFDIEERSQ